MNKKIYPLLGGLAALTCAFYIYFDCKMLQAQALTGRAHHTQVDNLELTYGHKSEVYGFLKLHGENGEARAGDPFQLLHGRTANKIRLKEMNWEQKTPYFMLARESGLGFSYDPGVRDLAPPEKSWILHAANLSELKAGKSPLSFDELKKEQLPRNLRITYLKNGSALATANWNNTGLILPMAFYKDVYLADEIRLEFEVDAGKYLNLLLDDNDNYRFAYANVYQLQSVKMNGNGLAPETIFRGAFLVQNQYSYNFPESPARVEIILKPVFKYMNFSRVDLFTTDAPPVREELLTPESGIF